MSDKLSTDPYKGVRDFYPEDMYIQKYIFKKWRKTMESFGYQEYSASILEPAEIYKAKTGEEIVSEQTYTFKDRGDREVTLRPEMTPTVARMVAKRKRDLSFPLRWYSIVNLFRYERPQKGRLREHWQLNADIFGIHDIEAEVEVIEIVATLLRNLGLNDSQFEIQINSRRLFEKIFNDMDLDQKQRHDLMKLIDRKKKIDNFDKELQKIIGTDKSFDFDNIQPNEQIETVIDRLKKRGVSNVVFAPEVMRGFDYYTDIVFEVFDTNSENNRSLFGGGRYDNLTGIFGDDGVPVVGFGQGDVTIRDTLETYGLLPTYKPATDIYICPLNDAFFEGASDIALTLREQGLNIAVDYSNRKIGDQIKKADKQKIPYVICVGDDEISTNRVVVKELSTGKEKKMRISTVGKFVKGKKGR